VGHAQFKIELIALHAAKVCLFIRVLASKHVQLELGILMEDVKNA